MSEKETITNETTNPTTDVQGENTVETPVDTTPENTDATTEVNELKLIRVELQEQKEKYLRLMAEFDNFRRRTAKENMELKQTAGKEIIISLLEVLDDCDRAEKQLQGTADFELQKEGIQLVFNKIRNTLHNKGLKAMSSIHEEFDVEKHEAITEITAPEKRLVNKVLDEVEKGYFLNDKIIRFAKVVVGK